MSGSAGESEWLPAEIPAPGPTPAAPGEPGQGPVEDERPVIRLPLPHHHHRSRRRRLPTALGIAAALVAGGGIAAALGAFAGDDGRPATPRAEPREPTEEERSGIYQHDVSATRDRDLAAARRRASAVSTVTPEASREVERPPR